MFDNGVSWASFKAFAADGLSLVLLLRIWVLFGFCHCWVLSGVFDRCFLLVASFLYILL